MNSAELLIYYLLILFCGYVLMGVIITVLAWIIRLAFKQWCGYSDMREWWDDAADYICTQQKESKERFNLSPEKGD